MEDCPGFNDRTEVIDTQNSKKNTAGRGMWIHFKGLNADPGQFEIVNSDEDPLKGDDLKLEWNTVLPYSTNLFYEPVPYEFLKTVETKPQVTVMVDGLHAACHSLECDYTYIELDSEITEYKYHSANQSLSIMGTNLPKTEDITDIVFGEASCQIDDNLRQENHIVCSL